MIKICTATSRVSNLTPFFAAVDAAQQLFSAANIELADRVTHAKHVSGATWCNRHQPLPASMHGCLCVVLDDNIKVWLKDQQQHQAVDDGGVGAVVTVQLPGIGVLQSDLNTQPILDAISDVQVRGCNRMLGGSLMYTALHTGAACSY